MAGVLVVCTGNVCRSPIAEGFLRSRLASRFGTEAPEVASAGTMGWVGSGADPASIEAAAERGVDISSHRARALSDVEVRAADLLLAMAVEHVEAIVGRTPNAAPRTFTLKELVRLLEALPSGVGGDPETALASRLGQAETLRRNGFEGNPHDLDVADPLGMSLESFRAIAWELDGLCARLTDGLFGRAWLEPAPGSTVSER